MACKKSIPIGSRFGRLVVIERTDLRTKTSNGGHTIYKCQCDCGNEIYVSSANLKRGGTQSCGCIHSLGEGKIQSLLSKANISFNKEYTFSDLRSCKNQKGILRYDFFVNNSYLIEYDGKQHFMTNPQGSYFTEEKLQTIKENDDLKNKYAKEHNIPLIRIPYTHLNDLCLEDLLLETSTFIIK